MFAAGSNWRKLPRAGCKQRSEFVVPALLSVARIHNHLEIKLSNNIYIQEQYFAVRFCAGLFMTPFKATHSTHTQINRYAAATRLDGPRRQKRTIFGQNEAREPVSSSSDCGVNARPQTGAWTGSLESRSASRGCFDSSLSVGRSGSGTAESLIETQGCAVVMPKNRAWRSGWA